MTRRIRMAHRIGHPLPSISSVRLTTNAHTHTRGVLLLRFSWPHRFCLIIPNCTSTPPIRPVALNVNVYHLAIFAHCFMRRRRREGRRTTKRAPTGTEEHQARSSGYGSLSCHRHSGRKELELQAQRHSPSLPLLSGQAVSR